MYFIKFCLISVICVVSIMLGKACALEDDSEFNHLPSIDECGISRFDEVQNKIINGRRASLGQFPWIARLAIRSRGTLNFVCSGVLLNRYYILTAAHCSAANVVRLGDNHESTDIDCEGDICAPPHQDVNVKSEVSGNYNTETFENDIALLLLEKPIIYNQFVVPVCLPHGDVLTKDFMGSYVTVSGWGITDSSGRKRAPNLLYAVLPIVNTEECNKFYMHFNDSIQYCAGVYEGQDSCEGDSGGPLTKSLKFSGIRRVYLIGIVSYGRQTCGTGPAIYTRVISYLDWILENIVKG